MAITMSDFSTTKHPGLKIHKDTVTFLFDIRIDGKRYRKQWSSQKVHTKSDRLKTAFMALEDFKEEVLHSQTITANMDATINAYFETLLTIKSTKWCDELQYGNTNFYNRYIKNTLGMKKIRDIKPAHFTAFNQTMKHLSIRSQKRAYEILKPIFDLAIEDEIITLSPIKRSHIPVRKQLEEKKIITDATTKYRLVHETIHKLYSNNPHHCAIFLFGFYGRRLGETTQLEWDDIDFQNMTYRVKAKTSKVNTDMVFALPQDLADTLLTFKDTSGYIFNIKNLDRQYRRIKKETGIREFTYHWMRNLSVSALASMGVDVTHLSAMLGHNDAGTLKKYLSLQREASTAVTNDISQQLLEQK